MAAARQKFEDLKSWKAARELTRLVYAATNGKSFSRDWGLRDQMRRASVSIMANIAEGYERGTRKEHIQFLFIAKGSSGELRSQLYVAKDQGYLPNEAFKTMSELLDHISRMLSRHITYLRESQ